VGAVVTARARLLGLDGRTLKFNVTVTDDAEGKDRLVAGATVERAAVDRERFLARIAR
jgi:predicted thioesterase